MDKHLITAEEFKELARPVSVHIDEDEVMAFVREGEDMYIIPAVGYAVCKKLAQGDNLSEDENTLLSGGEWKDKKGEMHYCNGLKMATEDGSERW